MESGMEAIAFTDCIQGGGADGCHRILTRWPTLARLKYWLEHWLEHCLKHWLEHWDQQPELGKI
jgi:hypothetical protein